MYWQRLKSYWKNSGTELWYNLRLVWPVFVALLVLNLLLAWLFYAFESCCNPGVKTFGDALYTTWITMTTVGYGDICPQTGMGRFIASFDAFLGIILIGVIVWLVTASLTQPRGTKTPLS